jgi:hypothetical protein
MQDRGARLGSDPLLMRWMLIVGLHIAFAEIEVGHGRGILIVYR